MHDTDDPDGVHTGAGDANAVDDRTADEPEPEEARRPWLPRLRPLGKWAAGIVAAVTATATTAWLLNWGLLPDSPPSNGTAPIAGTAPSTQGAAQSPYPSSSPEQEPFTVVVIPVARTTIGWITTLPPAEELPRPADDEIWDGWVEQTAAVSINSHTVLFTVQGTSEAQVTLMDMRIDVRDRRPSIRGYRYGATGGGPSLLRYVTADLDDDPPSLSDFYGEALASELPRHEQRPIRFPYRVSLTDAETFAVVAETDDCHCSFVIELSWASQGRAGTYLIDDNGEPFQVTGSSDLLGTCTVLPDLPEECG